MPGGGGVLAGFLVAINRYVFALGFFDRNNPSQ